MWKRKAEQYSEYTFDYIVDWLTSYEIYICIYVVNATDHIVICVCYQLRVTFMCVNDSFVILVFICSLIVFSFHTGDRRGRDQMVVGFTTTYIISAYHQWCCEFESRSGRGVQHYVIKFVSDLRQVGGFLRVHRFPPPIKLTATI